MTTLKTNPNIKPRAAKKSLREVYAAHSRKGRPRSERGAALRDFAAAYPCHIETARKVLNGRADIPAMRMALNDWFSCRGLAGCKAA